MSNTVRNKFLNLKSNVIVGNGIPVGGGYSLVNGKRCKGYARGSAIAWFQNGIWMCAGWIDG